MAGGRGLREQRQGWPCHASIHRAVEHQLDALRRGVPDPDGAALRHGPHALGHGRRAADQCAEHRVPAVPAARACAARRGTPRCTRFVPTDARQRARAAAHGVRRGRRHQPDPAVCHRCPGDRSRLAHAAGITVALRPGGSRLGAGRHALLAWTLAGPGARGARAGGRIHHGRARTQHAGARDRTRVDRHRPRAALLQRALLRDAARASRRGCRGHARGADRRGLRGRPGCGLAGGMWNGAQGIVIVELIVLALAMLLALRAWRRAARPATP